MFGSLEMRNSDQSFRIRTSWVCYQGDLSLFLFRKKQSDLVERIRVIVQQPEGTVFIQTQRREWRLAHFTKQKSRDSFLPRKSERRGPVRTGTYSACTEKSAVGSAALSPSDCLLFHSEGSLEASGCFLICFLLFMDKSH